jgi:hypothetical protein
MGMWSRDAQWWALLRRVRGLFPADPGRLLRLQLLQFERVTADLRR